MCSSAQICLTFTDFGIQDYTCLEIYWVAGVLVEREFLIKNLDWRNKHYSKDKHITILFVAAFFKREMRY